MTNMKSEKGFTLLEIIVVLAVLGALAAMLSPVVFRYIDDANRARAQADTRVIATAIQRMYADTGRWAYYKDGDGATAYATATDVAFLSSLSTCSIGSGHNVTAASCKGLATLGATWDGNADSLVRHLVTNADLGVGMNSYLVSGPRAWKGPYTDAIPEVDSWGQPYLVNIKGASPSAPLAVLVVSAGPDGILQTAANLAATTNVTPGGDDIISRAK